jgi:hypothetical protein
MDTPLYLTAQVGFMLLTIVYITLLIRELRKGLAFTSWEEARRKIFLNRIIVALLLWAAFVTAWSVSGKMSDFSNFPFNFMPVIVIPVILAVVFISSKGLGEILQHIPPGNLIRLQSFRFFVEILLWILFIATVLPVQMTFEGRNFDILAGITAPVIALLASRGKISKTGIIVWNLVCLGLLLNIVITAILSTHSPWRIFMNEPANYIVTYFPISWLPAFLVPLAYYLHFMSLRQMFQPTKIVSQTRDHQPLPAEK